VCARDRRDKPKSMPHAAVALSEYALQEHELVFRCDPSPELADFARNINISDFCRLCAVLLNVEIVHGDDHVESR
jgi:hypothetical protein